MTKELEEAARALVEACESGKYYGMRLSDISQYKALKQILDSKPHKESLYNRYIGKYVICRSYSEGINAGKVVAADETGVILEDARRLYYHKPLDKSVSWYEGVAKCGVSDNSRLGTPVEKVIVEDYSLTICTKEAEKSIREAVDNAQN